MVKLAYLALSASAPQHVLTPRTEVDLAFAVRRKVAARPWQEVFFAIYNPIMDKNMNFEL